MIIPFTVRSEGAKRRQLVGVLNKSDTRNSQRDRTYFGRPPFALEAIVEIVVDEEEPTAIFKRIIHYQEGSPANMQKLFDE